MYHAMLQGELLSQNLQPNSEQCHRCSKKCLGLFCQLQQFPDCGSTHGIKKFKGPQALCVNLVQVETPTKGQYHFPTGVLKIFLIFQPIFLVYQICFNQCFKRIIYQFIWSHTCYKNKTQHGKGKLKEHTLLLGKPVALME